jgi:hypothetical protein
MEKGGVKEIDVSFVALEIITIVEELAREYMVFRSCEKIVVR